MEKRKMKNKNKNWPNSQHTTLYIRNEWNSFRVFSPFQGGFDSNPSSYIQFKCSAQVEIGTHGHSLFADFDNVIWYYSFETKRSVHYTSDGFKCPCPLCGCGFSLFLLFYSATLQLSTATEWKKRELKRQWFRVVVHIFAVSMPMCRGDGH